MHGAVKVGAYAGKEKERGDGTAFRGEERELIFGLSLKMLM